MDLCSRLCRTATFSRICHPAPRHFPGRRIRVGDRGGAFGITRYAGGAWLEWPKCACSEWHPRAAVANCIGSEKGDEALRELLI
jgi:hypothetical protein